MTKFQNGHYFSFRAGNVPHNKGTKGEIKKIVLAPYIRLSDQMFNIDSETPSTTEREEMVVWLSLDRGSKLKKQTKEPE